MRILETIDKMTFDDLANCYDDLYFRRENIAWRQYRLRGDDQPEIYVTDLSEALKPGREVKRYIFTGPMWDVLFWTYDEPVSAVLQRLYRQEVRGIEYRVRVLPSMRVFSPFAEVKRINPPQKWTLPHVWKAILSGQITRGRTSLRLTDDYALDSSMNFWRGDLDLLQFARDTIEHPSGWWVRVEEETERHILIGVNCHHFDYKKLVFNKSA